MICLAVVTVKDDDRKATGTQLSDADRTMMEKRTGNIVKRIDKLQV